MNFGGWNESPELGLIEVVEAFAGDHYRPVLPPASFVDLDGVLREQDNFYVTRGQEFDDFVLVWFLLRKWLTVVRELVLHLRDLGDL